jgi:hypothetical protein
MFIDYQKLVFQDYQKKKADNALSPRLIYPTPAQIKEECIAVCSDRYSKKDEACLIGFFGRREDQAAYMQAIEKHETDKFKPLVNYLRSKVGMTELKNIELLAWLINFEPRPFEYGKRYIVEQEDEKVLVAGEQEENNGIEVSPEFNIAEPEDEEVGMQIEEQDENNGTGIPSKIITTSKLNFRILAAGILILLIISVGAGIYLFLRPNGPQGCMYWADDHYEAVSCNQKFRDKVVLALDTAKLYHFKRITEPDTITWKSKGSVWYVKVGEGIEFYTSDGFHPVQVEKRLRPVTDYIIYKYVYQK